MLFASFPYLIFSNVMQFTLSLNDCRYLKNKIPPEDRHKFHFFNSFFFQKLADLGKDLGSTSQGSAAFQRIRKWTRKVNLFEKDYIFIPINFK